MGTIRSRLLTLPPDLPRPAFLWGPRKVGKTHFLHRTFPEAVYIDLLKSDVYTDYASRPALLRERYADTASVIVIDEVQFVPLLLNEIQWMIDNSKVRFVLSGSSPRKLRRGGGNLLGGRAWRYTMQPLSWLEVDGFDVAGAMISGMLPPHFLSPDPVADLRAYVGDYLREEVSAEAHVQNMPAFAEFLRVAALTNGELLNYANVGRESGVQARTVRQYFQILEDTLLGFRLAPWRRSQRWRLIETEKFYLFDVGVCNYLARRAPAPGTPEFGKSFEHFILMEILAYKAYRSPELPVAYWRTSTGHEVDFILGDMFTAVEVKASQRAHDGHLGGLRALLDDHSPQNRILVTMDPTPRTVEPGIRIMPWQDFLRQLWDGALTE